MQTQAYYLLYFQFLMWGDSQSLTAACLPLLSLDVNLKKELPTNTCTDLSLHFIFPFAYNESMHPPPPPQKKKEKKKKIYIYIYIIPGITDRNIGVLTLKLVKSMFWVTIISDSE